MKLTLAILVVLLFSLGGIAQGQLKDLDVNFMFRGYFFAGSGIEDKDAPGGFGGSANLPKAIDDSMDVPRGDISIIAFPSEVIPFASHYRGIRVILANTTDHNVGFNASDSRLYIIQEAIDVDGKWKPVEYLPSSWCGNSYHTVYLPVNQYWEFAAARYSGKRPTKFRIKLVIQSREKSSRTVLSNEFEGRVNPQQFTVEQGHTPTSIMDPYNN